MNKNELRETLGDLFGLAHSEGYLSQFPDNHIFDHTAINDFMDYIDALPNINDISPIEDPCHEWRWYDRDSAYDY